MNKKIIYLLIVSLFIPLFAEAQQPQSQTEEGFSLYQFTNQKLSSYYRQRDFKDPSYSSGWYRVDDFLNWVEENEAVLTQIFQQKHLDEYTSFPPKNQDDVVVLAAFLGIYYMASFCQPNLTKIHDMYIEPAFNSSAGTKEIQIANEDSFAQTINSGLHEGAHALPYLCYGTRSQDPSDNLSELVPLSAQLFYGLPTWPNDLPLGTRNIAIDLKFSRTEVRHIYAQELLAYLQQNTLSKLFRSNNLRPLMTAKLERSSFSLNALMTDLIDLKQGKLVKDGAQLSMTEYLTLLHVQPKELKNVSSFMEDFLDQLAASAKLPKRTKAREWNTYSDKYDAYLEKHENTIKSILLDLIQQYPTPPVPSGFQ